MRRIKLYLFVYGVVLVGCATPQPTLRSSVDGFINQHVSVAVKWLGEPTVHQPLAESPKRSGLEVPTSRRTLSGHFPRDWQGTFYAWSSTGDSSGCLINLYVDTNGIVTGAAVRGDSQRCAHYADVLNNAPRRREKYCGAIPVQPCIGDRQS